jgi:N-methylhydantoinase A
VSRIIVPAGAGVMSAFGFLAAVPSVDVVRGYPCALTRVDWDRASELYKEMEADVRAVLGAADGEAPIVLSRAADMRYQGQGFEITVPLPDGEPTAADTDAVREAFDRTYAKLYGRVIEDGAPEVVSWRLSARSLASPPVSVPVPHYRPESSGTAPGTRRTVRFPGVGDVDTAVHDRAALVPGTVIPGPAVFQDRETSCAVGADCVVRVGEDYSLIIDIRPREGEHA